MLQELLSRGATIIRQNSEEPRLLILGEYHDWQNIVGPKEIMELRPDNIFFECINAGDSMDYDRYTTIMQTNFPGLLEGSFHRMLWQTYYLPLSGLCRESVYGLYELSKNTVLRGMDLPAFSRYWMEPAAFIEEHLEGGGSAYDVYRTAHKRAVRNKDLTMYFAAACLRKLVLVLNEKREKTMGETLAASEGRSVAIMGLYHARKDSPIYDMVEHMPYAGVNISGTDALCKL